MCELQWISYILHDLNVPVFLPISLWCDNQAAIYIASNPVFHERTKHLDIDCHLVRDKFKQGFIHPHHISTKLQLTDIFTKSLSAHVFNNISSKLGLVDFHQALTLGKGRDV